MSELSILNCDCIEYLKTIPDKSIDLILTDPPYGHNNNNGDLIHNMEKALGRESKNGSDESRPILNDGKEANELVQLFFEQAGRILKTTGCCCCCCCGGGGPDPQFARWSLWMDKFLSFDQMVIWDKGPIGMGWRYRRSYETILVGHRKGGKMSWYDESKRIENILRPSPLWKKIIPNKTQHPTQKPVGLFEYFISLHTKEGDMVLDPFCGSGTCGIASAKMNRRFIGIELDKHWYNYSIDRFKTAGFDVTVL